MRFLLSTTHTKHHNHHIPKSDDPQSSHSSLTPQLFRRNPPPPAMHSSAASGNPPSPEEIINWLQNEMSYPYQLPSPDQIRKICRGNMIPIWSFLLQRVRSESTAGIVRRNILVHGRREWEKGKVGFEEGSSIEVREIAARERDQAEEERERMGSLVRRQRREIRARMVDVAREELERKRLVDERSNAR